MEYIESDIQDGFMLRRGFRGRWLTVYVHRYSGKSELSERLHCHPWWLSFGLVLRGWFVEEVVRGSGLGLLRRGRFSVGYYGRCDRHRIMSVGGGTVTLFVGLLRRQDEGENATESFREGFGHYSERSGKVGVR